MKFNLKSGSSFEIQSDKPLLQANADSGSALMHEITWAALKTLRDNSQLIPGQFYRITDYTCTTTQANTSSAGHVFDIIVTADSESILNENARAIQHAGDTYFASSNLKEWQLKYCLDNDADRFLWADTVNGKGVIYRMVDESGNNASYDFKNILYAGPVLSINVTYNGTTRDYLRTSGSDFVDFSTGHIWYCWYVRGSSKLLYTDTPTPTTSTALYDYNFQLMEGTINSVSAPLWSGSYYTFNLRTDSSDVNDASLDQEKCRSNEILGATIKIYNLTNIQGPVGRKMRLNGTVFCGPETIPATTLLQCQGNFIDIENAQNLLSGGDLRNNNIGAYFCDNVFTYQFVSNRIGNYATRNTIRGFSENIVGCGFSDNRSGNSYAIHFCHFGQSCKVNDFNSGFSATVDDNFARNTINSLVTDCVFGRNFQDNVLSANTGFELCSFGEGIQYMQIDPPATGTARSRKMFFHTGIFGSSSTPLVITLPQANQTGDDRNNCIDYYASGSQEILI